MLWRLESTGVKIYTAQNNCIIKVTFKQVGSKIGTSYNVFSGRNEYA